MATRITDKQGVTFPTPVYKTLIKAFWDIAQILEVDGKEVIRGQVHKWMWM
ncbi:hypothetical protein Hanom_Chr11g01007721 [Helianthus anomalus]